MADRGHELTDEILNNLENRIADEYAVATRDMKRKFREYMEKFKAEDEKQKALLDAGKITKKEYSDWRYRHMMVGKRWEAMKDVLAEDLKHASDIALKISGEKMADVYALNANFATYQIEHDAKIDTGFTLYNHDTAEYLLSDERQLMPGPSTRKAKEIAANEAMQWNKQKIQSAVLQGVLQGEGPHKVAERLRQVGQMDYNASVRYARTMTTSAQNAGRYNSFRRARDLGVDLTIEWMATLDSRTRHEHRMMHGQRTTVDEPFHTPDGYTIYYPADCTGTSNAPQKEIWNCFVGDTKVASDCEIVRSYKHKFKGSLIRVRTAAGVDFTCTPNHPILTPDGWIPAAFFHKGDHLLITRVGDDGSLTRNGNVYHVHSSIKALHDSLESLGNSERISMSNFDFHGDVPTSDVEVVSKERLLRNNWNTCGGQFPRKLRLKLTNALCFCKRHFVLGFLGIHISSFRFVRSCCKPLTLLWRRLRHSDVHGFGAVAGRDACVSEYAINDLPTVTNIRSELLDGLAGNVFIDDVVSVDRKPGRLLCHVYNLQTESGYYFVGNSIPQNGEKYNGNYYAIAKNCRCTLRAMVKGYERETIRSSPKMGDMSFEEWQQEKAPKQNAAPEATTSAQNAVRVKTKEQAKEELGKLFGSVEDSFMRNDEELIVSNTNQLLALNERFGAIPKDNTGGYITGSKSKRAIGYTSSRYREDSNSTYLGLVNQYYQNPEMLRQAEMHGLRTAWNMPFDPKNVDIFTVTHEYGHILESYISRGREDWSALNQKAMARMVKGGAPNISVYKEAERKRAGEIWREIVGIAKENNPNFKVSDNISRYGKTNYFEAFAETFANSQLGATNELGNAMNEWLKREGF